MTTHADVRRKELMKQSEDFTVSHLSECAQDLIIWRDTAILCNGRFKELAKMCSEWAGRYDAQQVAESIVKSLALMAVINQAKSDSSIARDAARYHHIRSYDTRLGVVVDEETAVGTFERALCGDELDAAVDAEIALMDNKEK